MADDISPELEQEFADFDHVINVRSYVYRRWCREQGVSYSLYQVLSRLMHVGDTGATPSELADDFLIPRQTMTGILDSLTGDGLIVGVQDEADRRRKIVRLTPAGYAYVHEHLGVLHEQEVDAYLGLSNHERTELERIMGKYVRMLDEKVI